VKHRKPTTGSRLRSAIRRFSVPLATTAALLGAFVFSYADTAGSEGSGKITVAAEVWAVRVG
jgi:hypothetical protein